MGGGGGVRAQKEKREEEEGGSMIRHHKFDLYSRRVKKERDEILDNYLEQVSTASHGVS